MEKFPDDLQGLEEFRKDLQDLVEDPLVFAKESYDHDPKQDEETLFRNIKQGCSATASWMYRVRSYLLILGLILLYRVSTEPDAGTQFGVGVIGFLNSFSSAWSSRGQYVIGKPRYFVYIGNALRLLYKYIRVLVPSPDKILAACQGKCLVAMDNLSDQSQRTIALFDRLLGGCETKTPWGWWFVTPTCQKHLPTLLAIYNTPLTVCPRFGSC